MSDQVRAEAKISGGGSIGGGTYSDVTINGAGTINGAVDCINYTVNGAGVLRGDLVAQTAAFNGSGTVNGTAQVGALTVNGDGSIRDGAGVGALLVKGNMSVGGGFAGRTADIRGRMKVGGDFTCDSLTGECQLEIVGALSAPVIDIRAYGDCKATRITGEKITIAEGKGFGSIINVFGRQEFTVSELIGKTVHLENVVTSLVRGDTVTLGAGCRVGRVEYITSFTPMPGSAVTEAVQVAG